MTIPGNLVLGNPGASMPQAFTYDDAERALGVAHHNYRRGTGPRDGPISLGANTTIRRDENGCIVIRLYATDIITYHPDNTIVLNSGGHHTSTTKNRINAFLSPYATVYAKRHKWYIHSGSGDFPFEDGATLTSVRGRNPPKRGRSARIRQLIHEGYPDGHGQAAAIAYRESHARRNPGKFSSSLDEYVYQLSLDGPSAELGDVEGFGYYARLDGIDFSDIVRAAHDVGEDEHSARKAWEKEFHGTRLRFKDYIPAAILNEDSQGFVSVSYFMDDRDADKKWSELEEELEEFERGEE